MSLVRATSDPARETGGEQDFVEVTVELGDGRSITERARYVRGDPRGGAPLSQEERLAKFSACASTVLDAPAVERSRQLLSTLPRLHDVRRLTAALTPA
jgi:hypothetical protein